MSSTRGSERAIAGARAIGICLALGFAGWFGGMAASLVTVGHLYALGYGTRTVEELALSVAFNVVGAGGLALSYLIVRRGGFDRAFVVDFLRLRRPDVWDLCWIVIGLVGAFVVVAGYYSVVEFFDPFGTQGEGTTHSGVEEGREYPALLLLGIPVAILLTGPGEELLFRGVIQTRLGEAFPTAGAILLAGLVFAAVHVPVYAGGDAGEVLVSLGTVALLGVYLGVLYELRGNLVVPALVHGGFNAVVYLTNYLSYA